MKTRIDIGDIKKGDTIIEYEGGGCRSCRCRALHDAYIINEPTRQGWIVTLKYIDGDQPDMAKNNVVTLFTNPAYPAYAPIVYRETKEKAVRKKKATK